MLHLTNLHHNVNVNNDLNVSEVRQCTYNVTLRRVCSTIVAVEKQQGLHIMSVCL